MIQLQRILVPTDFSPCSQEATNYAAELARRFEAKIWLLHVLEPLQFAMPSPGAPLPDALLENRDQEAEDLLAAWSVGETGPATEITREVRRGQPFVEIIGCARDHDIDLIVMGTHGRTGLVHALIGSVAERVVRKAPCPVLSIRPSDREFVMP